MLRGGTTIHNWHVDIHENQSESNTTVASELAVSVGDKLLDSLGSVEGLHHFDTELVLEKHGEWHQVEWVIINTENGLHTFAFLISSSFRD